MIPSYQYEIRTGQPSAEKFYKTPQYGELEENMLQVVIFPNYYIIQSKKIWNYCQITPPQKKKLQNKTILSEKQIKEEVYTIILSINNIQVLCQDSQILKSLFHIKQTHDKCWLKPKQTLAT